MDARTKRLMLADLTKPGDDPAERLAHYVAVYDDSPDDMRVATATVSHFADGVWTGLTLGDLRALHALIAK